LIKRFSVETTARNQMVDVTAKIEEIVSASGVRHGLCMTQSLHTTAGLTLNENADPNVCVDILAQLTEIVPFERVYRHGEGNSDAHIKASLVGFSESLFVDDGSLVLGTWQGLYLCEFDGPRRRHIVVKVVADTRG
jgi:secondary thiamine-phosphate synthase enzyme